MSSEVATIASWRAQRFPWQAIIKMAGRPISDDARAVYDALAEMPAPEPAALVVITATPFLGVMDRITAEVAQRHGVSVAQIRGRQDHKNHVVDAARFEAMARIRAHHIRPGVHRFSLPQIGEYMGGRDHTTVMYGLRRAAELFGAFPPVYGARAPGTFDDSEETRL